MRSVRVRDTAPEVRVRSILHRMGYRFTLHRRDLPGTPDIVLPRFRAAVFVHGCFWHQHRGCRRATLPRTNACFWRDKFERNVARDHKKIAALRRQGWRAKVVWECQTKRPELLSRSLRKWLDQRQ